MRGSKVFQPLLCPQPENILCVRRTSHQIKLIDFGLARRFNPEDPCRVLFGTPEFIAPEIINYEPIGFASDMWSVGVICYVLWVKLMDILYLNAYPKLELTLAPESV